MTLGSNGARSSTATGSGAADPAAIFLVATIDEGGEQTVHDALPDISGLVRAVGFRDPTKRLSVVTSIGSDAWDRLFSGPRPAELHPFVELDGRPPQRAVDAGRSAVPHPGRVDGHLLRAGGPDRRGDAARSPSSTRCTASGSSTTATCWASSTAPRTRTGRSRCPPPRSATRIPTSRAAATCTCRSTCTTWRRGTRCRSTEQERVIGRTKLEDIEIDDDGQAGQLAHRAQRHRGRRRQRAEDRAAQHAVRRDRQGRVRHLLHRLLAHRRRSPSGCCATCSSATRRATPTASWTSPPRSPAACSSPRPSTSSTTHRRCRIRRPTNEPTGSHRRTRRHDGSLAIGSLKGTRQ